MNLKKIQGNNSEYIGPKKGGKAGRSFLALGGDRPLS